MFPWVTVSLLTQEPRVSYSSGTSAYSILGTQRFGKCLPGRQHVRHLGCFPRTSTPLIGATASLSGSSFAVVRFLRPPTPVYSLSGFLPHRPGPLRTHDPYSVTFVGQCDIFTPVHWKVIVVESPSTRRSPVLRTQRNKSFAIGGV